MIAWSDDKIIIVGGAIIIAIIVIVIAIWGLILDLKNKKDDK
jgi:hypothetical protein